MRGFFSLLFPGNYRIKGIFLQLNWCVNFCSTVLDLQKSSTNTHTHAIIIIIPQKFPLNWSIKSQTAAEFWTLKAAVPFPGPSAPPRLCRPDWLSLTLSSISWEISIDRPRIGLFGTPINGGACFPAKCFARWVFLRTRPHCRKAFCLALH